MRGRWLIVWWDHQHAYAIAEDLQLHQSVWEKKLGTFFGRVKKHKCFWDCDQKHRDIGKAQLQYMISKDWHGWDGWTWPSQLRATSQLHVSSCCFNEVPGSSEGKLGIWFSEREWGTWIEWTGRTAWGLAMNFKRTVASHYKLCHLFSWITRIHIT